MMKKIFPIILLTLTMISCSRENLDLAAEEEDPVFWITASLDGEQLEIRAGQDDFYMFSDQSTEHDGTYQFTSSFSKLDECEEYCEESFGIYFSRINEEVLNSTFSNTNDLVAEIGFPFTYQLISIDSTLLGFNGYRIEYFDRTWTNDANLGSSWTGSIGFGPGFELIDTIDAFSPIPTTLEVNMLEDGNSICSSSYSRLVSQAFEDSCFIDVEFSIEGDVLSAAPPNNNPATYDYSWGNGGDTPQITVTGDGNYCLTITDNAGCQLERCVCIINFGQPDMRYVSAAFSYQIELLQTWQFDESSIPNSVAFVYTDPEGEVFRSDARPQPASTSFNIQEIANYEANENGRPTRVIRATFNCSLFNDNGEELQLENGEAFFAVALP